MNSRTYCGHCHTCGSKLKNVLDGEEWCPRCKVYHRYQSHGWAGISGSFESCRECPKEFVQDERVEAA